MGSSEEERVFVPRPEALGWLAKSGQQPRKQRLIEGVNEGSLLGLKAEFYRVQEDSRADEEGGSNREDKRRRLAGPLNLGVRNAGVESRDARDKLELKTPADRLVESYSALERKAELYKQLATGQLEDDDSTYNVDFMRKGTYAEEESEMARQKQRSSAPDEGWNPSRAERDITEGEEAADLKSHRREVTFEVAEQTKVGRERAAHLKLRKADLLEKKKEQLKQALVKRKLQSLQASAVGIAPAEAVTTGGG